MINQSTGATAGAASTGMASSGMATTGDWLTSANLILLAIGAVLALLVIWWGARLKRQRKAVDRVMEERAEEASYEPAAAASLDDMPAPAPETMPPPVAPVPPPLADTPVIATAPFDAAPASVAADLATPPAPPAPPSGADDLTRMKGVGPKLAARLRELGVTSFAQIAALSPSEANALDAQLGSFQGRMGRDRWVEQAGYLARDDRAGFEAAFGRL
jgi:predicted flap endonuclease-1-like 5' DNA nuclease